MPFGAFKKSGKIFQIARKSSEGVLRYVERFLGSICAFLDFLKNQENFFQIARKSSEGVCDTSSGIFRKKAQQ